MKLAIARVTSDTYMNAISQEGIRQDILNTNIIFDTCFDVSMYDGMTRRFRFPNAEVVYFKDCDKNFPYFVLTPENFSDLRETNFLSHPCESEVFYRFRSISHHLDDRFRRFVPSNKDVPVVLRTYDSIMKTLEENFTEEPIQFGEFISKKD